MNNNRNFAMVKINGKEYQFIHNVKEGDQFFVITKNGVARRLKTTGIIEKIFQEIVDVAHTKALNMDEAFNWEHMNQEAKEIHHKRVLYGFKLLDKFNLNSVIEACHIEAILMDLDMYKSPVTLAMSNERSKHATIKDAQAVYRAIVDNHRFNGYGVSTWPHNNNSFIHTDHTRIRISFNGLLWFDDKTELKI